MSKKDNMFSMIRDWLRKFNWFNESFTPKALFVLAVAVVAFIPAYIGIFLWCLISPVGFWQVFATLALVVFVFGSVQMWFIILGVMIVIVVLTVDEVKGMDQFSWEGIAEDEPDEPDGE